MCSSDLGTQMADQPILAIGEVTGIPADEGRALSRALEYVLKRAQVQIAAPSAKPTHRVRAVVALSPPRGASGREVRNIDVRWQVRLPDDTLVGEVRQANDVPVRVLERDWPEIALGVADAAAPSIADLLKRPAPAR